MLRSELGSTKPISREEVKKNRDKTWEPARRSLVVHRGAPAYPEEGEKLTENIKLAAGNYKVAEKDAKLWKKRNAGTPALVAAPRKLFMRRSSFCVLRHKGAEAGAGGMSRLFAPRNITRSVLFIIGSSFLGSCLKGMEIWLRKNKSRKLSSIRRETKKIYISNCRVIQYATFLYAAARGNIYVPTRACSYFTK